MKKVLDHILGVWVKHPDLRLGQILSLATSHKVRVGDSFSQYAMESRQETFYIEDDKLIQLIQDFDERTATYKPD